MRINTIGEQEIWFRYFFNPYYFRTSVKTTFKGKKLNKAAIKCNLLVRWNIKIRQHKAFWRTLVIARVETWPEEAKSFKD